jgi:hypothetical protein
VKQLQGRSGQFSFAALDWRVRLACASLPIALAWLAALLVTA